MKELLQNLLKLQGMQFGDLAGGMTEANIAELRAKIPLPILGHYDRLFVRGKRGVAIVRNQVCTGCHMRVTIATVAALLREEDIQICENCGRYLCLPDETQPEVLDPLPEVKPQVNLRVKPQAKERSRKRKAELHAA